MPLSYHVPFTKLMAYCPVRYGSSPGVSTLRLPSPFSTSDFAPLQHSQSSTVCGGWWWGAHGRKGRPSMMKFGGKPRNIAAKMGVPPTWIADEVDDGRPVCAPRVAGVHEGARFHADLLACGYRCQAREQKELYQDQSAPYITHGRD